jgi:hypothetical protein
MDMGENNYTQENYDKYCDWWGVYSYRRHPRTRLQRCILIIKAVGRLKPTTIT